MTVTLNDIFIGNFRETQGFGQNPTLYKVYGLAGHEGVDFACPTGTQALAGTDGVVLKAGAYNGWNAYGNFVEIWDYVQHCATLYAHLQSVAVHEGQQVKGLQLIGITDNTGHTTGPHMHFGLCLTDAAGNRLNRGNGFGGWVNSLDANIAKWRITNPAHPLNTAPPPPIIPAPPPVEPPPPKVVNIDDIRAQRDAAWMRLDHIRQLATGDGSGGTNPPLL